jgi:hypothetical protein
MTTLRLLLFFFAISLFSAQAQYNPDAGRIASYGEKAKLSVSSGVNAELVRDNNHHTYWESGTSLPAGYISRTDLNLFHQLASKRIVSFSNKAVDGNLNTMEQYKVVNGDGMVITEIMFNQPTAIRLISLKAQVEASLKVFGLIEDRVIELGNYLPEENYSLKALNLSEGQEFESLILVSSAPFGLFEIAALKDYPFEYVQFDFGKPVPVGQVYSRHLNGAQVRASYLLGAGTDGKWFHLATLNPTAIPLLPVVLEQEYMLRYIRVVHQLDLQEYAKAAQWELMVYDRHGPFGPSYPLIANSKPLEERLGINGLWGWGYNTYSDNLPEGEGPFRFRKQATKARNYHEMRWDVSNPKQEVNYAEMAQGKGTPAQDWLNWDREYHIWGQAGMEVSATVMFDQKTVPDTSWGDVDRNAFTYAKNFAAHFGGNKLVSLVEAGNEPWDYPSGFYASLLHGFARGSKQGNAQMKVIPAAFQATFRMNEGHEYNNYIGGNIAASTLPFLDGLNAHFYSHTFDEQGIRVSVHPEDPRSGLLGIRNMIRYRDQNLPGKPVYVTEYGYDSDGGGENCPHSECVSELQQAAWGIRAALLLMRYGAEDVFWYFFANEFTAPVLHSRSGLTGSVNTNFQPKRAYYAFANLLNTIGHCYFQDILHETEKAHVYSFKSKQTAEQYVMAWRPVGGDPIQAQTMLLQLPAPPSAYAFLDGGKSVEWVSIDNSSSLVELSLSGIPMLIRF